MRTAKAKAAAYTASAAALMFLAGAALAHPGHIDVHGPGTMLALGFWHPLTGADHLLAMLAVGMWSALTYKTLRQALWLPVSFAALLLVGAGIGLAGVRLPAVEPMIIASLFVLGLLVASRFTMPSWCSVALVGLFAVFHGLAHGMELPADGAAMGFVAGFLVTTLILHLIGLYVGFKLKIQRKWISGVLGAGIAGYGALLFLGM